MSTTLKPRNDYRNFSFDESNRNLNEGHRERLYESMEDTYLLDLYPIVATSDGVIIDGQHRFSVARDMMIPFYAITGDGVTVRDIAEANSNTQKYDTSDALHVYSSMGLQQYQHMEGFLQENPHAKPLGIVRRWFDENCTEASFIDGSFSVVRPEYAMAVADHIADFLKVVPEYKWLPTSPYRDVIANLVLNPIYDHGRMLDRLSKIPSRLLRCKKISEAVPMLTHIYNYGLSKDKRVEIEILPKIKQVERYDKVPFPFDDRCHDEGRPVTYSRNVEIYCADDLDKFIVHPSCRPVKGNNTQRLVEYIQRRNLLQFFPIIVDRDMVVYDGQRRLLAAKTLNIPIYYIVANRISMLMMAKAGGRKESWSLADYLKHYCEVGIADYIYIREFSASHPWLRFTFLLQAFTGSSRGITARNIFTAGRFNLNRKGEAKFIVSCLESIDDEKLKKDVQIQRSFFSMFHSGQYDIAELARKLNMHSDKLGVYFDHESCMASLDAIYNYRRHSSL